MTCSDGVEASGIGFFLPKEAPLRKSVFWQKEITNGYLLEMVIYWKWLLIETIFSTFIVLRFWWKFVEIFSQPLQNFRSILVMSC